MRVAVYARVSGDRQKEEQTIQSQLAEIRELAQVHQWPLDDRHIYTDEGYSGYVFDRPGLDRLRDTARDGLLDLVLIHDPDRLARKYAYQVLLLEEFQRWGVQTRFVKQPPSDSPDQTLLVQIQGAISEYERARILERTRRGRLFWARQGRPVSARVPYGFRYVPRTREQPAAVVVDPAEAKVLGDLFRWYADELLSPRQIAARLTADGVTTPTGRSLEWDASSVRVILRSEAYLGTWQLNRYRTEAQPGRRRGRLAYRPREEWIPIATPALVEPSLFARAQGRREREQHDANFGVRPLRYPDSHLLRRLVVCGSCNYKMLAFSSNTGNGYRYYWCRGPEPRSFRPDRARCPHPTTVAEPLDRLVWADVVALLSEPDIVLTAWREQHGKLGLRQGEVLDEEERQMKKQLTDTDNQRQRLLIGYERGAIELEELSLRRDHLEQRAGELRQRLDQLSRDREQGAALLDLGHSVHELCKALREGLKNLPCKQKMELCRRLIDRVVVHDHSAEIHYRFPVSGNCNTRGVRHEPVKPAALAPDANKTITGDSARKVSFELPLDEPRQRAPILHPRQERGQVFLNHAVEHGLLGSPERRVADPIRRGRARGSPDLDLGLALFGRHQQRRRCDCDAWPGAL